MNFKFFAFLVLLTFLSCKKDNKKETAEEPATSFDKQALLVNLSDQIILPNYQNFQNNLKALNQAFDNYSIAASPSGIDSLRTLFHLVYSSYQHISLYEFGPAEQVVIRNNFNVFPVDTIQVNDNILSGSYDLNAVSNFDAKGLPALDFLLFGNQLSSAETHIYIQASQNRKKYIKDLILDMTTKINSVIDGWEAYREIFINSLSTDVSSSIGYLVNQLNFELDYIKNAKVGIPLGKKTLGIIIPGSCEAYYSERSLDYIKESVKALESLYLGKRINGNNQMGFDDYLDHLKVGHNGGTLNGSIKSQFEMVYAKLDAIMSPLSQQIISNPSEVDAAYIELVKLLVLLKTDMPSSLGVVITYQDGDGD